MKTIKDVITKNIKLIEDLSQKAFKDHAVTLRHRSSCGKFASWLCKKPTSGTYGFIVSIEPGRLMIFGDVGTCIWERTENMLEWAKDSIKDVDYFAGKVVSEIKTKEFSAEKAKAWLNEIFLEKKQELKKELKPDLISAVEDGNFEYALRESGLIDGCDFPDLEIWKPGFLWCREAIKWFLNNKGDI